MTHGPQTRPDKLIFTRLERYGTDASNKLEQYADHKRLTLLRQRRGRWSTTPQLDNTVALGTDATTKRSQYLVTQQTLSMQAGTRDRPIYRR